MRSFDEVTNDYLIELLVEVHGNQRRAAQIARMSRWALARLIKKHQINVKDFFTAETSPSVTKVPSAASS